MANALIFKHDYDELEIARNDDGFYIEIDAPWAGSTEEGFGQTLGVQLTDAQMAELILWAKARITEKAT